MILLWELGGYNRATETVWRSVLMAILINDPELVRDISEAVERGEYATPERLIRAAIDQFLVLQDVELTDVQLAELDEAQAQCDRGEGIPNSSELWDSFRKRVRER